MSFARSSTCLLSVALLATVLLVACGGSSSGTSPAPAGPTPSATPAVTPTPTETPVPTPSPVPQLSSTSTPQYYSAPPPTINFTNTGQTDVINVSETGYSGTFTVVADTPQTNGNGCSGTVATVTPSTGTAFTFTSSSSVNACGSLEFTIADSHMTNVTVNVVLTQTSLVAQGKHRAAKKRHP
jgi:hypothetical protein